MRMVRTLSPFAQKVADEFHASLLAAKFAQQIGLAAGNMWEPGISRNILRDYHSTGDWASTEKHYRMALGLVGASV